MDRPAVAIGQLREIFAGLDDEAETLVSALVDLLDDVDRAVGSFQGFRLTVHTELWPLTLVVFCDQGPDASSLRLPLGLLDAGFGAASRIVFYASRLGAFVDLAADLAYALRADARREAQGDHVAPDRIELDVDLPAPARTSGLFGLPELSAINRAIGVLIDHGHPPEEAEGELRRQAALGGRDLAAQARRLLS